MITASDTFLAKSNPNGFHYPALFTLSIYTSLFIFSLLQLRVVAYDGGIPAKSAFTMVEIEILHNFREPEFEVARYNGTILEDVPLGTSVLTVKAIDADEKVFYILSLHIHVHRIWCVRL